MSPLGVSILVILAPGVIFLPRRGALLALVISVLYLTYGAGLEIAGLNLFPTRLLGYVAFIRVLAKQEFSFKQLVGPDKAFIVLYLFVTSVLLIREQESILLYIAQMLDNLLTYFALRGLLRSPDDLRWLLKWMVVLLVPFVALLAVESFTGRNLFTLVGHHGKIWLREGMPRCYGSFRHPSLLGSLGACFVPLFIGLAFDPAQRRRAIAGAILCVVIVYLSNSGGPISVLMVAPMGWLVWRFRLRMQTFRRLLVVFIVLLASVMKAPLWYLPAKLSSFTGGTGWHRSYLMDVSFQHLEKWWLFGMPIAQTHGWFPYNLVATGGADITNQFVAFGLNAGILGIVLFIFVFYRGFSHLGVALKAVRQGTGNRCEEALLWGLGVALTARIFDQIGITYFDQTNVLWLLQLAAISSVCKNSLESRTRFVTAGKTRSPIQERGAIPDATTTGAGQRS